MFYHFFVFWRITSRKSKGFPTSGVLQIQNPEDSGATEQQGKPADGTDTVLVCRHGTDNDPDSSWQDNWRRELEQLKSKYWRKYRQPTQSHLHQSSICSYFPLFWPSDGVHSSLFFCQNAPTNCLFHPPALLHWAEMLSLFCRRRQLSSQAGKKATLKLKLDRN